MRVLKALLVGIVVLLVLAVGVAFVLPDKASVERSIVIARPAGQVYAVVESFTLFNRWSPWADLDPATRYTFEGPERGVGAKMSWASDDPNVGKGSQTITAVTPDQQVVVALAFEGMPGATATLLLAPEGDGTRVTWRFASDLPLALDGNFPFSVVGRYFGLAMDNFIGKDYDKGLGRLKVLLEGFPPADISGLEVLVHEVAAEPAYVVADLEAGVDSASSSSVLGEAYAQIGALAKANGITLAGSPYAVVRSHGNGKWRFDAGIAVERNDVPGTGRVSAAQTYAGKVAEFQHVGSYDTLEQTHAKASTWLATHGLVESGQRIELYLSDPRSTVFVPVETLLRVPVK
jgi:effector-binding domain-containing protein/uncharacterized protein YndB with AHSA1/START domain